jgi:hypothetical protein
LVHIQHDNVSDEWAGICQQALTPSAASSEPFIYVGRAANNGKEATIDEDGFPVDRPDNREMSLPTASGAMDAISSLSDVAYLSEVISSSC